MVPYRYIEFIDDLTTQVQNKVIPMSRIDDAVYRILRVKFTMGLFESPYADPSLAGELGKQVSSLTATLANCMPRWSRMADELITFPPAM
jgi:beta-glucosidase-like glycosyl hydrolase